MEFLFDDDVPVSTEEEFEINFEETEEQENVDLILIGFVERYPFIYDKSQGDFKNRIKKENAWEEIASVMGSSVTDVQKIWNRLRRRYTAERRILKAPPKSGTPYRAHKVWPLFSAMGFLEPHLTPRITHGNVPAKSKSSISSRPTLLDRTMTCFRTNHPEAVAKMALNKSLPSSFVTKYFSSLPSTSSSQPSLSSFSQPSSSPSPPLSKSQPFLSTLSQPFSVSEESLSSQSQPFSSSQPSLSLSSPLPPSSSASQPSLLSPSQTFASSQPSLSLPIQRSSRPTSHSQPSLQQSGKASGMSTPDAFHINKKAKTDNFHTFFKESIDTANKNLQLLAQRCDSTGSGSNSSSSGNSSDRHFANYLCDLFDKISSNKKKRACHQKLISVIDEFISDED